MLTILKAIIHLTSNFILNLANCVIEFTQLIVAAKINRNKTEISNAVIEEPLF